MGFMDIFRSRCRICGEIVVKKKNGKNKRLGIQLSLVEDICAGCLYTEGKRQAEEDDIYEED